MVCNQWYLAAWSDEVGPQLLARRILDEPIVLYRTPGGAAVAFADRCPHRKYPLSHGRLDGERLTCGYHGFAYDASGACVEVPGQSAIPRANALQPYPLVEKNGGVWLYVGNEASPDPARVPDHPWVTQWRTFTGVATIAARASLLIDNLMDLSHETFLHAGNIGAPEVAGTPIDVRLDGSVVRAYRRMMNVPCPPQYRRLTGIAGNIDRFQEIDFHAPCYYQLNIRVAPAGDTGTGYRSKVIYVIVPETEHTTHDFYAICREGDPATDWPKEQARAGHDLVLGEDVVALERLERAIALEREEVPEVSIGIDRGGLLARRVMRELELA